jgi:hypothetical protein
MCLGNKATICTSLNALMQEYTGPQEVLCLAFTRDAVHTLQAVMFSRVADALLREFHCQNLGQANGSQYVGRVLWGAGYSGQVSKQNWTEE